MIGRFVLRSTVATAVILFATGAANAACSIDEASASPTTTLPTMDHGQEFSFVASGCRTLLFSVPGTTLTKIPTAIPGSSADRTYRVFLTDSELDSVIDDSDTTLTWSITAYGPGGGPIARVMTTNELDVDDDGWTRSDGDVGECDDSSEINPGVVESCNNVDDDCNGHVDEGLKNTDCCHTTCRDGVWRRDHGCVPFACGGWTSGGGIW